MAEHFEFSQEELEQRFSDHWSYAEKFIGAIQKEFGVRAELGKRRLYLVIISAYKDIERYKNFHLDDPHQQRSDAIKRVAYLTKWLCRFKPLLIREADWPTSLGNLEEDRVAIVNELFALHLAAVHISVDVGRDFVIAPDKAYEIAYEMLYRHLSEDSFMLVFQMIRDHIMKMPIVEY